MFETVHLSKPDITDLEEEYVLRALRSGWVAPLGPDVDAFESEIARLVGVSHAVALSSGTAALHLALLEAGAGPGTFVILPTMTFAATVNAVMYTGAEPVFVDSQASDGNIAPDLLEAAIASTLSREGRIAAVVTVDLFGKMCDYEAIAPMLLDHNIPLIEDAAEALGSSRNKRMAGSLGLAGALSFNGNKIMTTSGGGMLLTKNAALAQHARKLSTQAREDTAWYEHVEIGYNYRLSNILAALGRAQLQRLPDMIEIRRQHRHKYQAELPDGMSLLTPPDGRGEDNCWLTCIVLNEPVATEAVKYLNDRGVEARHLWKPLHTQRHLRHFATHEQGCATHLFSHGLALPSGSSLTEEAINVVLRHLYGFAHERA